MILLRLFKNDRAPGAGAMILLLIAIFIPSFIKDLGPAGSEALAPSVAMPFYKLIFGAIHTLPVLHHFVAMLIIMLMSYLLIRVGVRDQLLQQRSVMPAIFFVLFTAALPEARLVSPALIGSLFYLISFIILFAVHDKEADTLSVFTASLILALGSMFCLKLIWFVPLIWVSLWTLRPVTWRELMYPVLAYFILALFLFTWYWGVMDNGSALAPLLAENLGFSGEIPGFHFSVYILYGYLLLLVAIASLYIINRFQSRKTVTQNIYQVMFYMFLAGVLFFVFIARFEPGSLVFMAIPLTFVLSNYFHRKKSPWIHEIVLWILLGLVVYVQLMA